MNSCALLIINAPWQIEEKIKTVFEQIFEFEIKHLTNE
jgi:23S rRNA A2030 N6-methylase RlmJ